MNITISVTVFFTPHVFTTELDPKIINTTKYNFIFTVNLHVSNSTLTISRQVCNNFHLRYFTNFHNLYFTEFRIYITNIPKRV